MGTLSGSFTADLAVGKICAERDTTEKGAKNETTSGSLVGRHARAAVLLLLVLCWCVCGSEKDSPLHYLQHQLLQLLLHVQQKQQQQSNVCICSRLSYVLCRSSPEPVCVWLK